MIRLGPLLCVVLSVKKPPVTTKRLLDTHTEPHHHRHHPTPTDLPPPLIFCTTPTNRSSLHFSLFRPTGRCGGCVDEQAGHAGHLCVTRSGRGRLPVLARKEAGAAKTLAEKVHPPNRARRHQPPQRVPSSRKGEKVEGGGNDDATPFHLP